MWECHVPICQKREMQAGARSSRTAHQDAGCRSVQASHGTQTAAKSHLFGKGAQCSSSLMSAGELGVT